MEVHVSTEPEPVFTGSQPIAVDAVTLAFPADVRALMPAYDAIPEEFKQTFGENKWVRFQKDWFFHGLKDLKATPKPGIDPATAWRHLKAIQGSYQPKHEHKEAAVA